MQGQARPAGQEDLAPEGNGTGFVWDASGHIVSERTPYYQPPWLKFIVAGQSQAASIQGMGRVAESCKQHNLLFRVYSMCEYSRTKKRCYRKRR